MMKYAIIAAGEGSRLKQGGIHTPKPLITILETPLIEMHIRRAEKYGFGEICVIVNDLTPEPAHWLANHKSSLPLETLVKTTPGSMYSFHALSPLLKNSEFLLTTVDPVFTEQAFEKFLQTVNSQSGADGIMAVTSLVDDENPLWVQTLEDGRITGYGNQNCPTPWVSAGFYFFRPSVIPLLEDAMNAGILRMRGFQQYLIERNCHLIACDVGQVIDVDYPADIEKAERLLTSGSMGKSE